MKRFVVFVLLILSFAILTPKTTLGQEAPPTTPPGVADVSGINTPLVKYYLDPETAPLLISFQIQADFDGISQEELYNLFSEHLNDDLWANPPSTTDVIYEGNGSKLIGRTWEQEYVFAGAPTIDTITRLWADSPNINVDNGSGGIADYVVRTDYSETSSGARLVYSGVYQPSPLLLSIFPDEPSFQFFFSLVVQLFEQDMAGYLETTGSAQINYLNFHWN